jgi:antitoxin (DNA-binding transcriptional repressor) of toxin-antitoxin stability system
MKTLDVRELQHHLGSHLDEIERGETIEVRRRGKIIARIVPHSEEEATEPWPNLLQRVRELYPDGPPREAASEIVYRDRGER